MRMLIDVRPEDEEPLRELAWDNHRSLREQAGYLLHQVIQASLGRTDKSDSSIQAVEAAS